MITAPTDKQPNHPPTLVIAPATIAQVDESYADFGATSRIQDLLDHDIEVPDDVFGYDLLEDTLSGVEQPGVGPHAPEEHNLELPTQIEGSASLRREIHTLLRTYRDIFSRVIRETPAAVVEMKIDIDYGKWTGKLNQAPRLQSALKVQNIQKQIEQMLSLGIIEKSPKTPHYSQIHMVPKPDGSQRMTIDYKKMNDCCNTPH